METEPKGLRKEDGLGTLGLFLLIVIFSCSICSTSLFGFGLPGNDVRENLHTEEGLAIFVRKCLDTKVGSPMWFSPTCASWVWISRGTSLRGVVFW